jgi:hypothetical protein
MKPTPLLVLEAVPKPSACRGSRIVRRRGPIPKASIEQESTLSEGLKHGQEIGLFTGEKPGKMELFFRENGSGLPFSPARNPVGRRSCRRADTDGLPATIDHPAVNA